MENEHVENKKGFFAVVEKKKGLFTADGELPATAPFAVTDQGVVVSLSEPTGFGFQEKGLRPLRGLRKASTD